MARRWLGRFRRWLSGTRPGSLTMAVGRRVSRRLPGSKRRFERRMTARLGNAADIERREAWLQTLVADLSSAAPPGSCANANLIAPTVGAVRSGFGSRVGRMHYGMDFAAPAGELIVAAASGEVRLCRTLPDYGMTTLIDHGDGLATLYAHQRATLVAVGQAVVRGQPIGEVGATGRCTGPHLHFEVRVAGEAVDPSLLLRQPA